MTFLHNPSPLTRDNAALVLVDHQVGLMTGIRDYSIAELKHNVVGLAKAAQADLDDAVSRQLKAALRRQPSAEDVAKMSARLRESISSYGNDTGLRYRYPEEGATVRGCSFQGNREFGIRNDREISVDARHCDWGDVSGPLDDSDDEE